MKQLIDDYTRRFMEAVNMLVTTRNNGSENDIKKIERIKTKRECYREFLIDLEKEKTAMKAPEMLEALKKVFDDNRRLGFIDVLTVNKIESLLKELE